MEKKSFFLLCVCDGKEDPSRDSQSSTITRALQTPLPSSTLYIHHIIITFILVKAKGQGIDKEQTNKREGKERKGKELFIMVRAVISRVLPKLRISKGMAKERKDEMVRLEELALSANVPLSVNKIVTKLSSSVPTSSTGTTTTTPPKVVIQPMGNSRRVFVLDPFLDATDMEGLAYRVHSLSKNEGINSILIASTDDDEDEDGNDNLLPRYVTNKRNVNIDGIAFDIDPVMDHTWYVAGGYDPIDVAIHKSSSEDYIDYLLDSLQKLALAVQGNGTTTGPAIGAGGAGAAKIPIVTLPHGAVTDGGYALCMGPYMLATPETSLTIKNPSKGLSFDPIGYSYILPRLGWDHQQTSSHYPGCGMILALSGYEANSYDMVQTGLATHLVSDMGVLPILEEELATMLPWNQQSLTKPPRRFYGDHDTIRKDYNADKIRNKQLAYMIDQITDLSADPSNEFPFDYTTLYEGHDASLDTDNVPWDSGFFSSPLVDMAIELDHVFRNESSLAGLIDQLKEIAAAGGDNGTGANHDHDKTIMSTSSLAKDLVQRMEAQSPLALRVVHQLMKMGSRHLATMELCMDREAKAQRKLMRRPDFINWATHVQTYGSGDESKCPPFTGWQHKDVQSVLPEEVDEILN
jgi:enoyl-CoA hydratase/carnithine racemase